MIPSVTVSGYIPLYVEAVVKDLRAKYGERCVINVEPPADLLTQTKWEGVLVLCDYLRSADNTYRVWDGSTVHATFPVLATRASLLGHLNTPTALNAQLAFAQLQQSESRRKIEQLLACN